MPELESLIEQKLIEQLIYGDSQWTYRPDLKTEADLWNNFKYILEQNNKDRLDGEPLSDSEFEQVKNQLQFSTFYKAGEWLVGENGKVMVHVQRDTKKLHLVVMNHEHIAGGSSVYEVINQYSALKDDEDAASRDRRFDVTLMINGLPMIHIELKNRQHSYMEAFNQIKKYIGEGQFRGIFSAVQMFVISNGVDTKYFSAASDTELKKEFISGWVDRNNQPVSDYIDFAKNVLKIPQAHEMIARYTVLDNEAKRLILLRPYQIHAIEAIREAWPESQGFPVSMANSAATLSAVGAETAPGMWPARGSSGSSSPRYRAAARASSTACPAEPACTATSSASTTGIASSAVMTTGAATVTSSHSISARPLIISTATNIRAGAVAKAGTLAARASISAPLIQGSSLKV